MVLKSTSAGKQFHTLNTVSHKKELRIPRGLSFTMWYERYITSQRKRKQTLRAFLSEK